MTTDYNDEEELLVNWPHRGADSDDCPVKALRRETLLEHWPNFDEDDDDAAGTSASSSLNCRHVTFSESSQLYRYEGESKYFLRSLAYTKHDRQELGKETLHEGLRIKKLITAAPPVNTVESIKYLLRYDIIRREELIGLEHFILDKPSRIPQIRQQHAAAVLWKQHELKQQMLEEDPVLCLGNFAESSSLKSTQSARIRAAMAA